MLIENNKKAFFNYFILDKYEAGIVLAGSEVKSAREGKVSLLDSFCFFDKDELFLKNAFISAYENGSHFNEEERRDRKLLLHKAEINKLIGKVRQKGYTIVPTKMYFKNGRVKVEIALAEGKELHDKRQTLKERDIKRDMERYV